MRRYWNAFLMCQSMFCALPLPIKTWDEEARPFMLLFLPVIGLEIGLGWYALAMLCQWLGLPRLVMALAVTVWPYLATGYLHLDGFMDVTDAVRSYRSLERRREILKDSHVGSFSVISFGVLLLAQFAFAATVEGGWEILILVPVVSRCGSAIAVTCLKPMNTSQYAGQDIRKASVLLPLLMACGALSWGGVLWGRTALALAGGVAGYMFALRRGYKSLEGMNGDISGYALTLSELAALGVLAVL